MKKHICTLSVTSFSKPCVNDLEAISRCTSMPQFLDNASTRARVYSWTLGLRCANRFSDAAITFRALRWRDWSLPKRYKRIGYVPLFAFLLNFVTKVQYKLPILAREVLISGLC